MSENCIRAFNCSGLKVVTQVTMLYHRNVNQFALSKLRITLIFGGIFVEERE